MFFPSFWGVTSPRIWKRFRLWHLFRGEKRSSTIRDDSYSYADAQVIQHNVRKFIEETLKLTIAEEKSHIRRSKEGAMCVGYAIKTYSGNRIVKAKHGTRHTTHKSVSERMQLHIPKDKLQKFCKTKGYGDDVTTKAIHRKELTQQSDAEIITVFNGELRGLMNFYALAFNGKTHMHKLHYMWERSLLKTLANKHKTSMNKIIKRLKTEEGLTLTVQEEKKTRVVRVFRPKDLKDERPEKRHTAVGIDVGLNRLATLSTGEGYENQAFLKTALKKLRQANKRLHRRKLGSKNREKARRRVARLHYRIACMREDVLHKLTTRIAACYGIIGIEDLHLKGLLKNRRLSRSFSDAALGTLLNLLTGKVEQHGGQVIRVGRFFPSSKTCHACGWRWEDMDLSDRLFLCQNPHCPFHHFAQDRDHNAAVNILREALRLIGLIDQVVTDTGSGDDVNWAVDLM